MTVTPEPQSGNPARRRHSVINRHQAELRELAAMMRERAGLAPAPVPVPLHKMGAARQAATANHGKD